MIEIEVIEEMARAIKRTLTLHEEYDHGRGDGEVCLLSPGIYAQLGATLDMLREMQSPLPNITNSQICDNRACQHVRQYASDVYAMRQDVYDHPNRVHNKLIQLGLSLHQGGNSDV